MRGRGLKHRSGVISKLAPRKVAPHAGAWIETSSIMAWASSSVGVAPHAGAWIETAQMEL